MTTPSLSADETAPLAVRLEAMAFAVLAILPPAMVVANRSATALVVLAAVCAVAAAVVQGTMDEAARRGAAMLRTPLGLSGVALAGVALVSVLWSHQRGLSLFAFGEALLPVVAALVMAATLPRSPPRWAVILLAASFALACLAILGELATGLALRRDAGLRAASYIFNRPVITLLLLYWPLAALLIQGGRRWLAGLLAALLVLTMAEADSGAAVMGGLIAAAAWLVARLAPRSAVAVAAAALLAALALAPVKGELAVRLLPDRLVHRLDGAHASDRVAIWQSFGEAIQRRPLLGTGFGSSPVLAGNPVAAEVPQDRRVLLGVGHPHDAFVQVWTELGAVGAVLSGLVLAFVLRALARLPARRLAPALACLAAMAGIALVGHGAWQGWWIAAIGATVVWFGRSGHDSHEGWKGGS